MRKVQKRSKAKTASFILGLPFTLLAITGGIALVINGIHSFAVSTYYQSESTAMLAGGICMAILGILHTRSGIIMTIIGSILALEMTVDFVVFALEALSREDFDILLLLFLAGVFIIGILELIGGIISIRNTKRLRKASPWIKKHKRPIDFLKEGLTASETIIEANYSKAFYDKNNLNVFKVVFPDATVLYRQQAVLRIANRLFIAGNDLSGNADPESTFFFEVITENGAEKPVPVFDGTEEHSLLTKKYYKLIGYVAPDTAQNKAIGANVGAASDDAAGASENAYAGGFSFTRDRLPEKAKKVIMIIIFALYGVTLILGILTATTGMFDGTFSSTVKGATKEVGRAYGIIMGLVWVTALPSVGYYIAFASPIKTNNRVKFFIAAGSAVLSIILDIVFFVVTKNYRPLLDSNDKWFLPFTVVAGSVCSFICYLLTALRTDSVRLKEIGGTRLKDANGLFEVIRATVVGIFNFLLKVAAIILSFKDAYTTIYALIAALLFTLLLPFTTFIVSFIIIVLAICTLVLYFAGFLHFAYEAPHKKKCSVYENGYERILTYKSYDRGHSRDVYVDDIGNYWYTTDGGGTFYKD